MKIKHRKIRNIIMPVGSFYIVDDKNIELTSIRIVRDNEKHQTELSILNRSMPIQSFKFKEDKIKMYRDEKLGLDVIEFVDKQKRVILKLVFGLVLTTEQYQKYIKVLMT